MVNMKEINTYSSQSSTLSAIFENCEITNKTIFQRTHNETFQSVFNHKMWNSGVDNRSSQFILEMVCLLERKIEVVFFVKNSSEVR